MANRLGVPLDLGSRWPDIVLYHPELKQFWIVDCVETDGEIDLLRYQEIEAAFRREGLVIAGFTTAYRTLTRFAQRQREMDNLAPDTYVWIMEIGGAHFFKESVGNDGDDGPREGDSLREGDGTTALPEIAEDEPEGI